MWGFSLACGIFCKLSISCFGLVELLDLFDNKRVVVMLFDRSAQASSSIPNGNGDAFAHRPQSGWTIEQGGGRVRTY